MNLKNNAVNIPTKLSVNINKIATLRNARGENNPDVLAMALLIESLGVDGITVHPRPDERHIKKSDVLALKKALRVELNVEGYPSPEFIDLMAEVRPAQVTLVPDPPHTLTSDTGFSLRDDLAAIIRAVRAIKDACSARVSIFIDPQDFVHRDASVIKDTGTDRIELYTYAFAKMPNDETLRRYQDLALRAQALGLGINAGHDLSLENLRMLLSGIPFIEEVSIGHALICDALLIGMTETIKRYLYVMRST